MELFKAEEKEEKEIRKLNPVNRRATKMLVKLYNLR